MKKRILALLLAAVLCLAPMSASAGDTLYGDANGDSAINTKDVLTMRKYVADSPVKIDLTAADCNGDNTVNMKDVLVLRMYLAELIDEITGKQPVNVNKYLRSVYYYNADDENFEINFYTFNKSGCLTLETDRAPDGTLIWRRDYTYDAKNREILCVYTVDDEKEIITATTYDAAGRISVITKTNGTGETIRKTVYTYDKSGHRISEQGLDGSGKEDSRITYTYNEKGQLVREETFDARGESLGYIEYVYTAAGYSSVIKNYGADGSFVGSHRFTYDSSGNLKTDTYLDENGLLDARIDYTYDAQNLLEKPLYYNFEDKNTAWKYKLKLNYTPLSATCVSWDGETVLWKQTYHYVDA